MKPISLDVIYLDVCGLTDASFPYQRIIVSDQVIVMEFHNNSSFFNILRMSTVAYALAGRMVQVLFIYGL